MRVFLCINDIARSTIDPVTPTTTPTSSTLSTSSTSTPHSTSTDICCARGTK